jgi:hypothetical protein
MFTASLDTEADLPALAATYSAAVRADLFTFLPPPPVRQQLTDARHAAAHALAAAGGRWSYRGPKGWTTWGLDRHGMPELGVTPSAPGAVEMRGAVGRSSASEWAWRKGA